MGQGEKLMDCRKPGSPREGKKEGRETCDGLLGEKGEKGERRSRGEGQLKC